MPRSSLAAATRAATAESLKYFAARSNLLGNPYARLSLPNEANSLNTMLSRSKLLPLLLLITVSVSVAHRGAAQDLGDRLSIHGSLNAAMAKADGPQYFGINSDGTTNYRAVALQFGYKLADDDRVVMQLLHRQIGDSPLMAVEPPMAPIWAFYEHREGDWTFKFGRNPLPRGLFNETRFIGTLLPFYRVGKDVYGETLENIDGVVVTHRSTFGGWGLDANAFTGGFDIKALLPGATATTVYKVRADQSIGGSAILRTPIEGLRFGAYLHDYQTLPKAANSNRTRTMMYSVDGDFAKFWARSEYSQFANDSSGVKNYKAWYAQAGVKFNEQFQVGVETGSANTLVSLPKPFPAYDLPFSTYKGVAFNYSPQSSVRYKIEWDHQEGYVFDVPVPLFTGPVSLTPPTMGVADKSHSNSVIASIAVAF